MQAEAVLEVVSEGNFVIIKGNGADANSDFLRQGYTNVGIPDVGENSDTITIVGETYTDNWDPALAQTQMEQFLTENNNEVDAVLSENDGMAGGVVAALEAQGLAGQIPVSGQDGDQAADDRTDAARADREVCRAAPPVEGWGQGVHHRGPQRRGPAMQGLHLRRDTVFAEALHHFLADPAAGVPAIDHGTIRASQLFQGGLHLLQLAPVAALQREHELRRQALRHQHRAEQRGDELDHGDPLVRERPRQSRRLPVRAGSTPTPESTIAARRVPLKSTPRWA